jgi:hypothetical protein
MTPEMSSEFDAAMGRIADLDLNFAEWEDVGDPLTLKNTISATTASSEETQQDAGHSPAKSEDKAETIIRV